MISRKIIFQAPVIALSILLFGCSVGGLELTKPAVFCESEGVKYQPGETVPQLDGCNACICSITGTVEACTEIACEKPITDLANPAAVKCLADGFHYEIREDPEGGQFGVCIDEKNKECDGWEYARGECLLGEDSEISEENVEEAVEPEDSSSEPESENLEVTSSEVTEEESESKELTIELVESVETDSAEPEENIIDTGDDTESASIEQKDIPVGTEGEESELVTD